ncbi:MAG: biotin--[acetyl-CoA-carboxylase] ligase [Verrucomicrobiota bacterium]|nr:biotin--[acetyl-CoA-carboxylase] ligase [Verrucomicrobiota bacterium]
MSLHNIHLHQVDSTQEYAKKHYLLFPHDQIVVIYADEQTAGRGTFQKPWHSPVGNLYATFAFRLPIPFPRLPFLAQCAAQSVAACLIAEGVYPTVKWPNDLLLNGKKVAGVLCEVIQEPSFIAAFVGIGVNLNMESGDLSKVNQPATSLKEETGREWDRDVFLEKLYEQFCSDLRSFFKELH